MCWGTSRNGHRGHAVEVACCFVSNSTSNVRQSLQWVAVFRDLFTSRILEDFSLSGVERLHYLKICLRAEAALLLKNLAITDGNFVRLAYRSDIKIFVFSEGNKAILNSWHPRPKGRPPSWNDYFMKAVTWVLRFFLSNTIMYSNFCMNTLYIRIKCIDK